MRIRTLLLGVALLALPGVALAEKKLPRAVDEPMVRPKVEDTHKYGNLQRHPAKFQHPRWGAQKAVYRPNEIRFHHSLHFGRGH